MKKYENVSAALNPNVWQDVKTDIETKILTGAFTAGERIPSTRQIAESYGVGESTAHKVLTVLWREGVIESKRGVGYFVKPFIREQLVAIRRRELERTVKCAVEEADLIDVDLVSMVEKYKTIKIQ